MWNISGLHPKIRCNFFFVLIWCVYHQIDFLKHFSWLSSSRIFRKITYTSTWPFLSPTLHNITSRLKYSKFIVFVLSFNSTARQSPSHKFWKMDDPSFKPVSQAQLNKAFAVQVQVNDSANKGKFDSRNIFTIGGNSQSELVKNFDGQSVTESEEEEDVDVDIISDYMGHYGWYQFFWTFLLCLFQFPTTFHIFCLVFQVSTSSFQREI